MRVKSELWVQAYIRRCQGAGIPAVLGRRGDSDAGAIFLVIHLLNGMVRLYVPAPAGLDDADRERRWVAAFDGRQVAEYEANDYLARQREFDPDLWVVEVEDRDGRHLLDDRLID